MKRPIIFLYAGQGSMIYQMGLELYQRLPRFAEHLDGVDKQIVATGGPSIIDAVYKSGRGKEQVFDNIVETHPAIYGFEVAITRTLHDYGIMPDLTVGVSLGSFAAAQCAGFIAPNYACAGVVAQGLYFQQRQLNRQDSGQMIAVMASEQMIEQAMIEHFANRAWQVYQIASFNGPTHHVISVQAENLDKVKYALKQQQIRYQALAVNFPFHTSWMENTPLKLALPFKQGHIPQLCTANVQLMTEMADNYLFTAIQKPIRWTQSVSLLENKLNANGEITTAQWVDLSPCGTLAALLNQHLRHHQSAISIDNIHSVFSLFGGEQQRFAQIIDDLLSG